MPDESPSRATPAEPIATVLAVAEPFRLDGWEVEPAALTLRGHGEERRLEPRVMALLVCLAENAGRPVTREELLERVWSDVVVGDDAIHSAVSKLRRALANGSGGRAVETVPKIGYRLASAVERPEVGGSLPTLPRLPRRTRRRLAGGLLVVLAIAVTAGAWLLRSPRETGATAPAPGRNPHVLPITSWPGLEVEPAFAPGANEDRIAFASRAPAGESWDLWLQVLGDGDPFRLTRDPGSELSPAWSPDARYIAFVRRHEGACAIHRVPALGGREVRLAGCTDAQELSWSPDGTLLWADRPSPEEPFRVVALDLAGSDGGTPRELTRPAPGSLGDLGPVVSPDGTTLAFRRSPVLGVQDLYLQPYPLPSAGARPRRLTHDDLKIHGADWSAGGEHLVFSSNRGGLFSLWQIPAAGGEPTWLGVSGGDLDAPSAGGGGRRIAYEQWNDDTNLYRVAIAPGAEPERLLGSTRWDWGPHAAPRPGGGSRIAFLSDRSGSAELWLAETMEDGEATERRLTGFGGPYVGSPSVSPDGRSIAFDARPGGNADLYLWTEDRGEPLRLTRHPGQDEVPTWSRDGRSIYFASDRSGSWQVWRMTVSGGVPGEPEPVTREGGYRAEESPDGGWLYVSRRHEAGLWRLPLDRIGTAEAAAERVLDDLAPLDRAHWRVTADGLLYLRRPRHDRPVLTRHDPETGAASELTELGDLPYNSGLALSADGGSALFTRKDRWESDVMVLEVDPEAPGSARAALR